LDYRAARHELRLYVSVPKMVALTLLFGGLAALGWWIWMTWQTSSAMLVGGFFMGAGGLGLLSGLAWLFVAVVARTPLLTVNDSGFIVSLPFRPSRDVTYPWPEIAGIGINVKGPPAHYRYVPLRAYFLVLYMRSEDDEGDEEAPGQVYPSESLHLSSIYAPPVAALNLHYLLVTRERRAQLLERIKTTFAPEISRYHIRVDEVERPL
jgi:hypothetical protein